MIVEAIKRYYPDWEPPEDNGRIWVKCLCPFHGESNASAAISFDLDGFNCMGCSVKGDAISIIRHEEGLDFGAAKRVAESLSVGGSVPLQRQPARKPSRRVFGEPGHSGGDTVRPGVRRKPPPWT